MDYLSIRLYFSIEHRNHNRNNHGAPKYNFLNFFLEETFLPIVNQRAKFIVTWVYPIAALLLSAS